MNARGLVELIILTAALEKHVITPTLFSMMVVMAVVTTVMASPALRLLYGARHLEAADARPVPEAEHTPVQGAEAQPATA
jgi:K+:H+ antiporter